MTATIALLVIAAIIVAAAVFCVKYYNMFITQKNRANQSYSDIDVFLKKRSDLIPNLVGTVERYMKHENETLTRITQLRARMTDSTQNLDSRVAADKEMNQLLGGLMIQLENYPELKADTQFMELFSSLESMEGQLSAARRTYNAVVTGYNNSVEMFPGNIMAGIFSFKRRDLLEATAEERQNPSVKQLFSS